MYSRTHGTGVTVFQDTRDGGHSILGHTGRGSQYSRTYGTGVTVFKDTRDGGHSIPGHTGRGSQYSRTHGTGVSILGHRGRESQLSY